MSELIINRTQEKYGLWPMWKLALQVGDDDSASRLCVLGKTMRIGEAVVRFGGVAGVGTRRKYRLKGYASRVMFDGTILAISHDRYFLDRIVHRIVEVQNQTLKEYAGTFSDFWKRRRKPPVQQKRRRVASANRARPSTKSVSSAEVAKIEERIDSLEEEKLTVEKEITAAYEVRKYSRGESLSQDLRRVDKQLQALYSDWERVSLKADGDKFG